MQCNVIRSKQIVLDGLSLAEGCSIPAGAGVRVRIVPSALHIELAALGAEAVLFGGAVGHIAVLVVLVVERIAVRAAEAAGRMAVLVVGHTAVVRSGRANRDSWSRNIQALGQILGLYRDRRQRALACSVLLLCGGGGRGWL